MSGPLIIKVKKEVWRKVEQIIAIAEEWVKKDIALASELKMLKHRIWDLSTAQIDELLTKMLAVNEGLKKVGGKNG